MQETASRLLSQVATTVGKGGPEDKPPASTVFEDITNTARKEEETNDGDILYSFKLACGISTTTTYYT